MNTETNDAANENESCEALSFLQEKLPELLGELEEEIGKVGKPIYVALITVGEDGMGFCSTANGSPVGDAVSCMVSNMILESRKRINRVAGLHAIQRLSSAAGREFLASLVESFQARQEAEERDSESVGEPH